MPHLPTPASRLMLSLVPALADGVFRFVHASSRWTIIGGEYVYPLLESQTPFFCASWHFDLLPMLYYFRHTQGVVMVSRSRDGDLIARMVERWGYKTVRGSKHKGGLDAGRDMIRLVKTGLCGGLVADGSQGPPRKAQTGPVFIARATQVPLVPAIVAAKHKIIFNSWDRMEIPLPFTRLALYLGEPILVPPRREGRPLEESRVRLENALNRLCESAENHPW